MTSDAALADLKVVDFMWVLAGPGATRVLADYGATVVRVESSRRLDTARTLPPFNRGRMDPESSGLYANMNAGKLSLALDLGSEEGRAVALDLVRWGDVVTESFSPRAMRGWGLDYESLRRVKPDVIMLSSCLMGQTGPLSSFAGFGNLTTAISGLFNLASWPDRPPAGPFGAYTDYVAPRFTVAALLAALDYRRRTGKGQYIDQSQMESGLHFAAPALLEFAANGREPEPSGNRDREMAPHGVFPAAGQDRWVAIAVRTEEQWAALCGALGKPDLARDGRFATRADRRKNLDALDAVIAEWTRGRDMYQVEAALQRAGVPASAVQNSNELYADAQLAHRGHFVTLPHGASETIAVEGSRFRLSRTPARVERAAPRIGEHTRHVLESLLGYSNERIAELEAAQALR